MNKPKVVDDSLAKARKYSELQNYGRSFAHYLVCFELDQDSRTHNARDFAEVLCAWGNVLEEQERFSDLYKCYQQALQYLPQDAEILNNFGSHLLRNCHEDYAEKYLELATSVDPDFLPAEKNLVTCKLNLVPRWHFRMLNDFARNDAYRRAIAKIANSRYDRVLDIGAGSGILSLFASSCGPNRIVAIESSKALAGIAREIFAANNVQNATVINSNSTYLSDIGRSNLLVTEIFDTALFGEHVLKTLIHAWDNLLEPWAKVIPCSADIFVAGISSDEILTKHKLCTELSELKLVGACVTQAQTEPYDAERLQDLECDFITDTKKVLTVDFSNVSALKDIYTNSNIPLVTLKCDKPGTIVAVAVWFDLHLDDNIMITTNPGKDSVKCWEQAVVYLDHPIAVHYGDNVRLKFSCVADKVEVDIIEPASSCSKCWKVSQQMITFLNDSSIVESITKLAQSFEETPNQDVLDLCPFPLFGLLLAKKGARVHCTAQNQLDHEFLSHLNNINCLNVTVLPQSAIFEHAYDVVFAIPLSTQGLLCEKTFRNVVLLGNVSKKSGVLLPLRLNLMLTVVEAPHLEHCCKVNDDSSFGFKVAEFMNTYAVKEEWDVNPKQFAHRALSQQIQVGSINLAHDAEQLLHLEIDIVRNGRANGILYWYELCYSNDISGSTYDSRHFSCACFVIDPAKHVKECDKLSITIKIHRSLLKIWCT